MRSLFSALVWGQPCCLGLFKAWGYDHHVPAGCARWLTLGHVGQRQPDQNPRGVGSNRSQRKGATVPTRKGRICRPAAAPGARRRVCSLSGCCLTWKVKMRVVTLAFECSGGCNDVTRNVPKCVRHPVAVTVVVISGICRLFMLSELGTRAWVGRRQPPAQLLARSDTAAPSVVWGWPF